MAQVINTNIASLNAQNNLNKSQSALQTALSRLSSGMRINSAKDDAAGLAISERFSTQIRGLNQASRNAADAVSLTQTAEGSMNEIVNNLQRIRELAVQSLNATNSASDRSALDAEVQQLKAEIDRVAQTTSFNGVKLLDGTFSSQVFQVGANAGETIAVSSITSMRTTALGAGFAASVTGGAVTASINSTDLSLNGVAIGASVAGSAAGQTADSGWAIAAAINAASGHGVVATAAATQVAGGTTGTTPGVGTVTINGVTTASVTLGGTAATNRASLVSAINSISAATGVVATDDGTGIDLAAADGRRIVHSFTQASGTFDATNTGLGAAGTARGSVVLTSTGNSGITVAGATPGNAGLSAGTSAAAQTGTALSVVSVLSVTSANTTLATIDSALTTVNSARGDMGAYQNRFASTIANIQTTAENLTASRSRILDADFAAETANLTRAQILQQAGTAMLAQANAIPNNVLTLLRG